MKIILFPGEADQMVQSLKPILPDIIGTSEWFKQQEYIDKLNLQVSLLHKSLLHKSLLH